MRAIIFDMDGLLIDSEPLWHEAEKAVFATVGLRLTTADCLKTTGLRVDEVVRFWKQPPHLADQIVDTVIALIREKAVLKPGADEALALFRPVAIASSSALRIIEAVIDRFGWHLDVAHSAENEPRGKPDPAVYLTAARKLGIAPRDCVAIEDSQNGVLAAKAAGMTCIAVPDVNPVTGADLVLPSLTALNAYVLSRW